MTPAELDRIEKRAAAATRGSWHRGIDMGDQEAILSDSEEHPLICTVSKGLMRPQGEENTAFLEAARDDVLALCRELREAWAAHPHEPYAPQTPPAPPASTAV